MSAFERGFPASSLLFKFVPLICSKIIAGTSSVTMVIVWLCLGFVADSSGFDAEPFLLFKIGLKVNLAGSGASILIWSKSGAPNLTPDSMRAAAAACFTFGGLFI